MILDTIRKRIFTGNINDLSSLIHKSSGGLSVVTMHAEMFWQAYVNKKWEEQLRKADVIVADGMWLSKALIFWGIKNDKITGVDLADRLVKKYPKEIFFWGGGEEMNKQTVEDLSLAGGENGYNYEFGKTLGKIKKSGARIVLVGIGGIKGSARQIELVRKLADEGLVSITVGGSFEVLTGRKKRAPKIIQKLGFESIWRMIIEPKRIVRFPRLIGFIILVPYLKIKCLIS